MNCQNHPADPAAGSCAGCAEPFCSSCLVSVRGATYCAACKSMAVTGLTPQAVMVSQDAKTALWLAVLGIFCWLGFILGPVAIFKASRARQQIAANPALGGTGWANAATVVGAVVFLLGVLNVVMRARGLGR